MLFGEKVRQARIEINITQAELAERVNVTRQTISLIESGNFNPSLKLCIDISLTLEKTLDELFWIGNVVSKLSNYKYIFITDIGSTTTKGMLLYKEKDKFNILSEANKPTTVEKPLEDVKIGILEVARELEIKTGVKILTPKGKIKLPYLTTSSAGGGLQILVFGITASDTGKAAELTVYGAGGVILKTFTIDDKIPVINKMRMIRDLHPDMIFMAGGMDGGNITSLVRISEMLSLSKPSPKFREGEKIPLVYAGNKDARKFIKGVLENNFEIHLEDNIRPTQSELITEPVKKKILEIFMENVMERAPGYSEVKKWVVRDIIPTPSGVENLLKHYGERQKKNIVMVDIGGATTDIFSYINSEYSRTVAANIGMSFSISEILAQAGIEKILSHLPGSFNENDVRNYISNKMINPTYIPVYRSEILIEHAAAIEGISIAWLQHQEMNYKVSRIGFLERMKKNDTDHFQKIFYIESEDKSFQLSDFDIFICSGGVLSNSETKEDVLKMVIEGFKPSGIVKILLDKSFKSPHLGVLSTLDSDIAIDIFEKQCIEEIGYIIAPVGKISKGKKVLSVKHNGSDLSVNLKGGEITYLKNGGDMTITSSKNIHLKKNIDEIQLSTELPVLIDCRGRGDYFTGHSIAQFNIPEFNWKDVEFKTEVFRITGEMKEGIYTFKRELPYEGKIFVKNDDNVEPDSIIGENTFTPPRIFLIDINQLVGYDKKLTEEQIQKGLLVKLDDMIHIGDKIFKQKNGIMGTIFHRSSVRGKVIQIETNGMIVLREIQDYSDKPVVINIAKRINVKPKYIKSYLRFKEGDFIEKGVFLASLPREKLFIKSPSTGIISEVDTKKGLVTIHYNVNPIPLMSFLKGRIIDVRDNISVNISAKGTLLFGVIGFGGENFGEIIHVKSKNKITSKLSGKVVVSFNQIDDKFLEDAKKSNISGIIAPSMNNLRWVNFYNEEIGVALTGEEKIPFTLILTEGFGNIKMNEKYIEFFENIKGSTASLSGRTQIRAGVTRPLVLIHST